MYSIFNEGKAVVIERFNRTLKNIMWKYFTANNTRFFLDAFDQMVKNYNDKVHSTIKMTPKIIYYIGEMDKKKMTKQNW